MFFVTFHENVPNIYAYDDDGNLHSPQEIPGSSTVGANTWPNSARSTSKTGSSMSPTARRTRATSSASRGRAGLTPT